MDGSADQRSARRSGRRTALAETPASLVFTAWLPDGNRSTDSHIAQRADTDGRVLVTNDRDSVTVTWLARTPRQLLVAATGNITNNALLSLFELHLDAIVSAFEEADIVELSQDALTLGHRTGRGNS